MNKFITVLLIMCICLTGCSVQKEYDLYGRDKIEALRADAAQWQSGRYLFTDLDSGIMDQAFSFMYNEDGTQTCLYERTTPTSYYAEYNDGKEIYILDGGNVSTISSGDPEFVLYSRENPHPYSTNDLLFYVNLYVASSAETSDEDGNTVYTYIYDTGKLNKALGMSLTEFRTEYYFDGEGNFLYFTQTNSDSDGTYSYRIDVIDVNELTEIENPCVPAGTD